MNCRDNGKLSYLECRRHHSGGEVCLTADNWIKISYLDIEFFGCFGETCTINFMKSLKKCRIRRSRLIQST
jgi:hypothetical protein